MATLHEIANYFIEKAYENNKPISNKKLQKLVYYAQVWFLVHYNTKLFRDKIEAWIHGPAIPALYSKYRRFSYGNLPQPTESINLPNSITAFLDEVWRVYGKLDANYLEQLTHSELPWQQAREGLDINQSSSKEINMTFAKNFYAQLLNNSSGDTGATA
ncbi:MAG TPA: type II toxin-antitoxin system antitoxin SocA domain-containing protein [Candidatus Kapabacteria bacterium]|nr:type II toxin-antitoxin system antitoxin SocA domain-containing protein [Candidatus Kapabacteria bacterium]